MKYFKSWCGITVVLMIGSVIGNCVENGALLDNWIAAQTNITTWSADAVQTRVLKTFNQPLISTGKVWVVIPDRFRWELGQPPQTIAVRQPEQLWLIYPKLKRAEKYPLSANDPGPWRDALALLEASFPQSRAELESQFAVVSAIQSNSIVMLSLQPKSSFARKFISQIQIRFNVQECAPLSTELQFSDGSSMRNDFSHSITNAVLPKDLFEVQPGPDIKIVEPLKK